MKTNPRYQCCHHRQSITKHLHLRCSWPSYSSFLSLSISFCERYFICWLHSLWLLKTSLMSLMCFCFHLVFFWFPFMSICSTSFGGSFVFYECNDCQSCFSLLYLRLHNSFHYHACFAPTSCCSSIAPGGISDVSSHFWAWTKGLVHLTLSFPTLHWLPFCSRSSLCLDIFIFLKN